ncbi:hypothetical protein SAMN05216249_103155 [Acetitomaculum ruminis DSM 5522]|uniref:Uncharacterized protein n=1 Tax=Acetitomaculum ruminis DSM 5522 TaxID=1120918 RepID=A0A1I0W8R6_9FIRM|nr:hypothetical protein [Acetitomaculum ruminis]SFA84954.1 hypothetical protein SAMN05216249_103155 [Acetitomaculum ruminis DSM 5522]
MVKKIANKIWNKRYLKRLIIIILIPAIIYFSYLQVRKYLVIRYLNQKYGDGDWKIIACEKVIVTAGGGFNTYETQDGVKYTVASSYIEGKSFHIYIRDFIIHEDDFLPTYYSIKYNLDYHFSNDDFWDISYRIAYITCYHYPYQDDDYTNKEGPNSFVDAYAFYNFKIEDRKPKPDVIPDKGRIPDIKEIIEGLENYYCAGRKRNKNIDDEDCYKLAFSDNFSDETMKKFIADSIEDSEKKYTYYN